MIFLWLQVEPLVRNNFIYSRGGDLILPNPWSCLGTQGIFGTQGWTLQYQCVIEVATSHTRRVVFLLQWWVLCRIVDGCTTCPSISGDSTGLLKIYYKTSFIQAWQFASSFEGRATTPKLLLLSPCVTRTMWTCGTSAVHRWSPRFSRAISGS